MFGNQDREPRQGYSHTTKYSRDLLILALTQPHLGLVTAIVDLLADCPDHVLGGLVRDDPARDQRDRSFLELHVGSSDRVDLLGVGLRIRGTAERNQYEGQQ